MIFSTNNICPGSSTALRRTLRRGSGQQQLRDGFTLMELMLVLAILVGIGAIAWPSINRAYESSKLKAAADRLISAFNRTRVQAMTTGQTHVFMVQLQAGTYSVEALPDDPSSLDTSTTSVASGAASAAGCHLPDGYVFAAANRVLDERASTAESTITSTNFDTSTPPVLFYSDGTSSEAQVTVANQNGRAITVSLRSLTGTAHMGEIQTASDPASGTPAQ